MGNRLTNFEQGIKSSFDGFEVPYDPDSWDALEQRLDQQAGGSTNSSVLTGGLVVVSSLLLIIAFYFMIRPDGEAMKISDGDNGIMINRAIHGRTVQPQMNTASIIGEESDEISKPVPKGIASANDSPEEKDEKRSLSASSDQAKTDSDEQADTNSGDDSKDEDLIKVEGSSKVSFKSSLTEACAGVEVTFELVNEEVEGSYLWNFGDGNFSNQPNPTHVFEKPGAYDISLSVRSLEDGVIRSNSISKMIVVNPKPKANFDWEYVNDDREITKVQFLNRSERAKDAEWQFHDGKASSEINPENNYKSKGDHLVKLIVSNDFGCIDSTFKYVDVERNYNLNAPKSFSLKKDEGFMPEALKSSDVSFTLTVYDNKQPIFETMSTDNPWKGNGLDGNQVTPGMSYPWVVIIYDEFNEEKEIFSGTITVNP